MSLSDRIEYRTYNITLVEPILGSLPSQRLVYQSQVAAKAPEPDVEGEEEMRMLPGEELPRTTVFLRDEEDNCCLLDYQLMGFLKEAGNTLKGIVEYEVSSKGARSKKTGIKNLRSKLSQFLYIGPRIIPLHRKPDGVYERPLQAMTARGPRTCLASSEIIHPEVSFEILIGLLPHEELSWVVIEQLLEYGQFKGLGQFRGGGYGRFTFDLAS